MCILIYMTSTQAQKETKMNEITNTRTAIKNAIFDYEHTANMNVTTFTDTNGKSHKIVSGAVRQPIGAINFRNEVKESYVKECVGFHEDLDVENSVSTTSTSVFTHSDTIAVTLTKGERDIWSDQSEFDLFLSPKTARKMAEAILAQLDEDEA